MLSTNYGEARRPIQAPTTSTSTHVADGSAYGLNISNKFTSFSFTLIFARVKIKLDDEYERPSLVRVLRRVTGR